MFGKRIDTPVKATDLAKAALGITPTVKELGEKAVGIALEPTALLPGKTTPAIPTSIPSDPLGHLNFAKRAVAQMTDDEAGIVSDIEVENLAHCERIASLELRLENVRKTRAFYETAPDYLAASPSEPAQPVEQPAEVADAAQSRRRSRSKPIDAGSSVDA